MYSVIIHKSLRVSDGKGQENYFLKGFLFKQVK